MDSLLRCLTACCCVFGGCVASPENVVENMAVDELDPLDGSPDDGFRLFEVTVDAQIEPPYDRASEGDPLAQGVGLFHCGAVVWVRDDALEIPDGTVALDDVGAVMRVDYDAFGEQEIRLGGAGPYNLSLIYDTAGTPVYSEAYSWNDVPDELGTFRRALDSSTPIFRVEMTDAPTLHVLDPSASYDAETQTITTSYSFQTENGQEHSLTESYQFGGRHIEAVQSEPWGCD